MQIRDFKLERYFAAYEFSVRHMLSASDCEALSLAELLALADAETRALWQGLKLSYTESQGHPLLRAEVAGIYHGITPDELLIAAPEELIFIAMNVLLAPGDHVIATFPGYQSLYEIAQAAGCTVTHWPLTPGPTGWQLDLDFLARSITPQTKLLVINFPHNPTGFLPMRSELDRIILLARRHGLTIFSDEMYRLLEYRPADRLPSIAELYERGIALSGLSKAFALPGLRIGWLATHDQDLLGRCLAFHDYTTLCASAPGEILGIIALRAKAHILARNLALIRDNAAAFATFCARHNSLVRWLPPRAGSVAFPQLRADLPVAQFVEAVLARKSVMILPGDVFEHTGNHFRVGLGRADFQQALGEVERCVEESGW